MRNDFDYLRGRYFDNQAVADLTVSDNTRKRHVETILGRFRYRLCALDERVLLEEHARQAARIFKPAGVGPAGARPRPVGSGASGPAAPPPHRRRLPGRSVV